MTKETAERIVKGITDKVEANTADMNDWAEFWGFTVDEYEEFLDMAVKTLDQQSCGDAPDINVGTLSEIPTGSESEDKT